MYKRQVELAFIVEPRNDAALQILIGAGLQLPAEGEERCRRAAVQPARHIIPVSYTHLRAEIYPVGGEPPLKASPKGLRPQARVEA